MAKINENSSMLIISERDGSRLLVAEYDQTYFREAYRGRINLIGGARRTRG